MQRTGLMKVLGSSFNVAMYDFRSQTSYLLPNYELPEPVSSTILELIDAPPLPADGNNQQGLLRLAVAPDSNNWQGAAIYNSTGDGYDYKLLATATVPAVMGVVLNKLQGGSAVTFDNHNEIIVQLMHGSLSSVSELVLLNGANAALIGDELLQFQNAELIGERKYKLTRLLRGRQGTEWAIRKHKTGDRFILLTSAMAAVHIDNYLTGKKLLYKPVSIGRTLAETDSISFTYNARSLKPFAPIHAKAIRDGSGNISISWIRRSRIDHGWRDYVEIPLGEEIEQYQIVIKKGKQLARTLTSATPAATYTKEQQTADFGQLPKKLTATIIKAKY